MSSMGYFETAFNELLTTIGTSTYKVSLDVGEDPSRVDKILFKKKPVTFEKRLETLRIISESTLLAGKVDFETLAYWLAQDYLPADVLKSPEKQTNLALIAEMKARFPDPKQRKKFIKEVLGE